MLEIAPEKVAHIIIKAREYDAKVAAQFPTREAAPRESRKIFSRRCRMIRPGQTRCIHRWSER